MENIEKLYELLNNWVENNPQSEINFNFKEDSLYDDESIKNMRLIFYYLKNKKNITNNFDKNLSNRISKHIVNYLNSLFDVSNEIPTKKEKRLKYKITPKMLEYKSYNKTKFKNLRGLYGLMQMN